LFALLLVVADEHASLLLACGRGMVEPVLQQHKEPAVTTLDVACSALGVSLAGFGFDFLQHPTKPTYREVQNLIWQGRK